MLLKAVHTMPALHSQKLSKYSEAKHHLQALGGHIKLWDEGNIKELLREAMTVQ